MAGLTGLFRRGTTYYMRVVLPLDHPLRAERPTGRIVISLGSSNYREALSKGYAKRAEILTGVSYETVPGKVVTAKAGCGLTGNQAGISPLDEGFFHGLVSHK